MQAPQTRSVTCCYSWIISITLNIVNVRLKKQLGHEVKHFKLRRKYRLNVLVFIWYAKNAVVVCMNCFPYVSVSVSEVCLRQPLDYVLFTSNKHIRSLAGSCLVRNKTWNTTVIDWPHFNSPEFSRTEKQHKFYWDTQLHKTSSRWSQVISIHRFIEQQERATFDMELSSCLDIWSTILDIVQSELKASGCFMFINN